MPCTSRIDNVGTSKRFVHKHSTIATIFPQAICPHSRKLLWLQPSTVCLYRKFRVLHVFYGSGTGENCMPDITDIRCLFCFFWGIAFRELFHLWIDPRCYVLFYRKQAFSSSNLINYSSLWGERAASFELFVPHEHLFTWQFMTIHIQMPWLHSWLLLLRLLLPGPEPSPRNPETPSEAGWSHRW